MAQTSKTQKLKNGLAVTANRLAPVAPVAVLALATVEPAFAGTDGTEFDGIWDTLTGWTQGTLGKIVSGGMILIGVIAGMARQSLMSFATGIGGGMGLYNSPTVVEAVVTATVTNADKINDVAMLGNGLM